MTATTDITRIKIKANENIIIDGIDTGWHHHKSNYRGAYVARSRDLKEIASHRKLKDFKVCLLEVYDALNNA